MTPGSYTRRPPTVTAVQWDGSDEAAAWIVSVFPGATRDGDRLVVRDSLDREMPLDADVWVVQDTVTGIVNLLDGDTFTAAYEQAE